MTTPRRVVVLLAGLGALAAPGAATAAVPASGTLSTERQQLRWEGELSDGHTPHPAACAALGCDEFRVRLGLSARTWRRRGGVQLGVRWGQEGQEVDLYVYGPDDPNRLAASSTGTYGFSAAQSVLLREPRNGRYRVVVVPVHVTKEGGLGYKGIVEVERPPAAKPRRELRPNLVPLPTTHAVFGTGLYYMPDGLGEAASCYPEETIEEGAQRCLRFNQSPANLGDGPFELRYLMTAPGDPQLRQRVYRSDGSFYDRIADSWEFHPTHAHFHYKSFMSSRLWASNSEGRRLGQEPVRTSRKTGFCMIDVDNVAFGRKGDAAKTYGFPRCNAPTDVEPQGAYMTNGISVGWADVYSWFLPDQYIEVSGVADGYYLLESVVDPDGTVLETNESDNAATTLIRLCGSRVEIVGQQGACP